MVPGGKSGCWTDGAFAGAVIPANPLPMSLHDIIILSIPAALAFFSIPGPGFKWLVSKTGQADRAAFVLGAGLCLFASVLFALFLTPAGKESLGIYRLMIFGLGLFNLALLSYNLITQRKSPKE